jgi:hypothetical protein
MRSACLQLELGRGLRPDIKVVPTPWQVAARADPILE